MSDTPKWTPGPWSYGRDRFDDWGTVRDADGYLICQAKDHRVSHENLNEFRAAKKDPWEATARLISAAPDQNEALEDALADRPGWREKARRALAKARGEETP